jgi:diguanylate cyclase (GGDEF)-like protein/PAS domain S-box-containing protein
MLELSLCPFFLIMSLRQFHRQFLILILGVFSITGTAAPAPGSIRVVLDDNYPPYTFRDSNGKAQGILKDMWDLWAQRTGVTVDFQPMDWGKAQEAIGNGQADVIDTMFETEARKKIYDFSRPYATIEVPIIFHKSISGITDANSLRGFTIGVKDGDACIDYLSAHGVSAFKRYPSYEAEVKAAVQQEIRILCIDKPPAIYFFNREGAAEEFRYSPSLYVGEFHRAVIKGRSDLKRLVEDGFSQITEEERAAIETRWLGEKLSSSRWSGVARYGWYVLFSVVLVLLMLGAWNWALRRQVAIRTRELSSSLQSLQETENRFRTLFEQANDAIFIMQGLTILDCNSRAEVLFARRREQLIGVTPLSFSPALQPGGQKSEELIQEVLARVDSDHALIFEWQHLRPDGSLFDVEVNLGRVNFGGEPRLQAIIRNITERKQAEEKISHLAFFDQLTDLPNRTLLQDRLKQAMANSQRSRRYGALLLLDLDHFKTLNDTLGHDMGDLLLKRVAGRLTECIREEDTVARLGGDEFVVMLVNLSASQSEAAALVEIIGGKLIARLNQPYDLNGAAYDTTPSVGACVFLGQQIEADTLMKQADLAMYKAKEAGRNIMRFFDPDMALDVLKRASLDNDLRIAVQQQQFVLHFQAQVAGSRVTGVEALLRWQHPERGLILPGEFISVIEETGLILQVGQWVLENACKQLASWARQPGMSHLTVAVNISARQFIHENFVAQVLMALDRSAANPALLKLELTESLLVNNVEDIINKMNVLKARGVGFSLDDFGTGYSSLSYLKRMPLDQLKIDQSFVRDILSDPNDATIAKMIVVLAASLGLVVIAEGVETEAQRDSLAQHGCLAYQGYLFSRPLPLAEFELYMKGCNTPL